MMRIFKLFLFFFFLIPLICFGFEEDLNPKEANLKDVPLGMEAVEITDGSRVVVPMGAKVEKVGAQIIVEKDAEYFSRRFYEIMQEIESLKESVLVLQGQVEKLNQTTEEHKQSDNQMIKVEGKSEQQEF
ncbi:MAG: hypothetical protein PHY73_01435 [Candidatus Omnitrophica bacterium]|nr:hypothetical protein [Candidatus Omnitrophota bacterium]